MRVDEVRGGMVMILRRVRAKGGAGEAVRPGEGRRSSARFDVSKRVVALPSRAVRRGRFCVVGGRRHPAVAEDVDLLRPKA